MRHPDAQRFRFGLGPDQICDRLDQLREELGISYICMSASAADAFAPVVARLAGT